MEKVTRKFFAMLIALSFIMISVGSPVFAGDHSSCKVNKIGVYPGTADPAIQRSGYPIFLTCTDLGTDQIMFFLSDDMGDAGLATALTAMSLTKDVWTRTTTDVAGGLVTVMYLAE